MKTIQCVSHFKAVTNKDSIRKGEKRASLNWSFDTPEVVDIQAMDETALANVARVVRAALESYARTLLLKNAENWSYIPNEEEIISCHYYVQFLNTETSRSRVVTKETLELAALWYQANCGLIGKPAESGLAGASVIRAKLVSIAGNAQALEIMAENLVRLLEKCLTADAELLDTASPEELETVREIMENTEAVTPVISWLVTTAEKLIEESKADLGSAL